MQGLVFHLMPQLRAGGESTPPVPPLVLPVPFLELSPASRPFSTNWLCCYIKSSYLMLQTDVTWMTFIDIKKGYIECLWWSLLTRRQSLIPVKMANTQYSFVLIFDSSFKRESYSFPASRPRNSPASRVSLLSPSTGNRGHYMKMK